MSGTAISQLPAALAALPSDLVPVVETGTPNVTKRVTVSQLLSNTLPTSGGTYTGLVEFQQGLLIDNNHFLQWRDTTNNPQNVMALDNSNNVVLRTFGTGFYLENAAASVVHSVDTSGNFLFTGTGVVGSTGIQYQYTANHFGFGWNGYINLYVDGTYEGDIATTSWVNTTLGPYATQSWVSANYKPIGAYTPNQNVDNGSSPTFGNVNVGSGQVTCGDVHTTTVHADSTINAVGQITSAGPVQGGSVITTVTSTHLFSFWVSGGAYIRMDNTYDYGPIAFASDARLKEDIQPADLDCLDLVGKMKLNSFKWRDSGESVPVGFTTQQLREVLPGVVNAEPKDAPPREGGIFYESVNTNVMLALLAGAVQQLAGQLAELKAAAMKA